MFGDIFQNKRVLVTGHTGFKGSWLCEWLYQLGARVHGLALDPEDDQPLFGSLDLQERLSSDTRGDIRNPETVVRCVESVAPEFIFHLAAQPLVRRSYLQPVETFATNVMGVVHLLDAVRVLGRPCVIVIATTDKCYENQEWISGYREQDPLGGHDPYSASKACAELAAAAFRRSYFHGQNGSILVATARAGNVIGGGDRATDRIVPDAIRALEQGAPVPVRNRTSTRPWQHVLEPLGGYLWLAAALSRAQTTNPLTVASASDLTSAFNFGPGLSSNRTVKELVESIIEIWPGTWQDCSHSSAPHEAARLNLAIDRAHHLLQWSPVWDFPETVRRTVSWYRQESTAAISAQQLCIEQISDYTAAAFAHGLPWAAPATPCNLL